MNTIEAAVAWRRILGHVLCAVLLTANAPLALDGQELEARATLSPPTVRLNQQFVLNIEVTGTRRTDVEPAFPSVGSFARYLGQSSSTNMRIVNGVTTASVTIQYRFQAIRVGTFEIGTIEVETQGQVLRTQPLSLTVSATAAPGGGSEADTEPGVSPDDLFIVADMSKRRVYENEPIEVSYRLFTRVNVNSYSIVGLGENEGFWVEDVPPRQSPQVEQIVRDGQQYTSAVVRRVILFPAGPGTKTVEPLSVEASVRVQRRRRSIFDDVFGGGSLFGSQLPVMLTSEAVGDRGSPPTGGWAAAELHRARGAFGRQRLHRSLHGRDEQCRHPRGDGRGRGEHPGPSCSRHRC